jgi:hypothetical protein
MDIEKLNIDDFSINELLDVLDASIPISREEIELLVKQKENNYKNINVKSIFGKIKKKLFDYLDEHNINSILPQNVLTHKTIQREDTLKTTPHYQTNIVAGTLNPLRRRQHKRVVVINTKDRKLHKIIKCKDIPKTFNDSNLDENERREINNTFGQLHTDNLNRVLTTKNIYDFHEITNRSTSETKTSFDPQNCCPTIEVIDNTLPINDNTLGEKKNCGNTNNKYIKNLSIDYVSQFEMSTDKYEENASNYLYDFVFKHSDIIKTTLSDICIKKDIISLFYPGKSYSMDVIIEYANKTIGKPINITIQVLPNKENLNDILSLINTVASEMMDLAGPDPFQDWFIQDPLLAKLTNTFSVHPRFNEPPIINNITFKTPENVDLNFSLAYKLNILEKTFAPNIESDEIELNYPDYLYFEFDDMTNNYYNTYYATTRESSLTSSVLAKIPLKDNTKYTLENTNTDLDLYSREYFGKINIEKARFRLLDPDGNLININQENHIRNNYYFTLVFETVYDL